jgi:hypothetical protein
LYYSATIHYMRIREKGGLTVPRDGSSLPEAMHEILTRNYARLPVLEGETHELPLTRKTHLVLSPAADTAEYIRPIGAE